MIDSLPTYIHWIFGLTTLLTIFLFFKASGNSWLALGIILLLLFIQAVTGLAGFYTVTDVTPPHFLLLVLPPLLIIITLFLVPKGRTILDRLDQRWLTWLHSVRIPVELVLFWLFLHKQVPQLMTFEGRNFDIAAGLTAPLIAYFGYHKKRLNRGILLTWNFICLGLLFNIVINAILSAPFPFQRFAFDQPNVAILYFPFVWLPGCIVPLVLLAHLATIRQLILSGNKKRQVDR